VLVYLGAAIVVGVAGSMLLSQRIKRQTLGLEPREITQLARHRETMLHRIKEGVLGLDAEARVTLMNDEAGRLIGLPADSVGRTLAELGVDQELSDVLTGARHGTDLLVVQNARILVLNRESLDTSGDDAGSVTTVRDRTEMLSLQRELDVTRSTTNALRAQAHEFLNRLHVISGLVQLERYDDVVRYITSVSVSRAERDEEISSRIASPTLAALLVAKTSLASERQVLLQLSDRTSLGHVDEEVETDLVTVTGNLIDNAVDVVAGRGNGLITVDITVRGSDVLVAVEDNGPGVPAEDVSRLFEAGYTTKIGREGHGIGLALVRMVCKRRGGDISVERSTPRGAGTTFIARLPLSGPESPEAHSMPVTADACSSDHVHDSREGEPT
jgi:sensor histidine kinase regulating citrate/malate metabolism